MKAKLLLTTAAAAALGLTTLQASAQAPFAPRTGDETDTSWMYRAPKAGAVREGAVAKAPVRIGDENDLSWMYVPVAKGKAGESASTGASKPSGEQQK